MIDYTKILFHNINPKRLEQLQYLDFKIVVSEKTGEMSTKKVATYHFCKIVIYDSGTVRLTGSIHKLYNSLKGIKAPNYKPLTDEQIKNGIIDTYKGYNGNQFTINNIFEIREHLQNLFDCTPEQMAFQNIEFGVNSNTLFDPKQFIKGLLYHNGILFEFRFKNNYAQVEHQRSRLKIYNKSYQYGRNENVLRVEVGLKKSIELKKLGISTFADITENTLNKAKKLLLKRFDEVIHYDYTIDKKKLTKRQKILLKDYSRPLYWIDEVKPIHRDRHKKRLHNFVVNNSENLHQKIRQYIIQKCVIINRLSEYPKCVIINSSSIGLNITQNAPKKKGRFCHVTGVNISMQKQDSILLSHTGLKHYYKTDKKIFDKIKKKYLSDKWLNSDYETQIKEIAHNIRNKNSSWNRKHNRLYPTHQKQLFEILV